MNRDLALAEWRLARESLGAAEILARERYYRDAVSRTYYAVLHAAKAALHVHDVSAKSHSAVRGLFGLHLIRRGEIEAEWASHVGESLDDRLRADYNPEASFSVDFARRECRQTHKFLRRIRRYLRDSGLTEAELRKKAS